MKRNDISLADASLECLLKETLTSESQEGAPSLRVISAVMSQVRGIPAPARRANEDAFALALFLGTLLAGSAVRYLSAFPTLVSLLNEVWWRLGEGVVVRLGRGAFAALSALSSLDFGKLFPLFLVVTLVVFDLAVHRRGMVREK